MQKILLILFLLPFVSQAQNKLAPQTNTPLLLSIVSDTLKEGNYKAVLFEYDQLKRVTTITDMLYETKESPQGKKFFEKAIRHQYFLYHNDEQLPYLRRVETNDFDEETAKTLGSSVEDQIFLLKNGKRIGDSIINYPYRKINSKLDFANATKAMATFVQSNAKVVRVLDLTEKKTDNYYPENIDKDSIVIKNGKNIGFESSEQLDGSHYYPRAYFTFTKFDQAINPLHQLNIASLLSNEKISLSFGSDEMQQIGECFDGLGTEFNWPYLNQNNRMNYHFERGETESPFKDLIQFSYTYNQFHQPTYCRALVKKIFKQKEDGRLAGTYKKAFTFRYK